MVLAKGYYIRRISIAGYVTGHLTNQGGFGNCHAARAFPTAKEATEAAETVLANDWLGDNYNSDGGTTYHYERDGIVLEMHSDGDIFVLKSPFVCRAQFCSPCAPGAGYLPNPCSDGPLCYCLPIEWFDEEDPCPYVPVLFDASLVSLFTLPPEPGGRNEQRNQTN